jgi:hypothetical protein
MKPTREAIDQDELARRLSNISMAGSERILDRTLALYEARTNKTRRRPGPKPGLLIAVVLVALVAGSAAIAASSPASDQLLRFAGLAPRDSGRIQNVVGSATSSGQTVQVLGAYGDATRTVVFLHTTAGGPVWATLTTDSGQDLSQSGGGQTWERDGAGAIAFGPIANPRPEGEGVTLNVLSLRVDGWPLAVNGHDLKGDWKIYFSVKVRTDSVTPKPATGKLGDLNVTFRTAGGSGDSVFISFETAGATFDELKPYYCTAYGWCSAGKLHIQVFDPNGKELKLLQSAGSSSIKKTDPPEVVAMKIRLFDFNTYWAGSGPGMYRMVLTYQGQLLEASFAVS